jgi:hypothetical protein
MMSDRRPAKPFYMLSSGGDSQANLEDDRVRYAWCMVRIKLGESREVKSCKTTVFKQNFAQRMPKILRGLLHFLRAVVPQLF